LLLPIAGLEVLKDRSEKEQGRDGRRWTVHR